jgi:hypothetical protein
VQLVTGYGSSRRARGVKRFVPCEENREAAGYGMLKGTPVNIWRASLATEYPRLAEIMERLLPLTIQSADVECCCQLNSLIHTKMWNRLPKNSFKMLFGCRVNTRLQRLMSSSVKGRLDRAENEMDMAPINVGFLSERAIDLLDEESDEE